MNCFPQTLQTNSPTSLMKYVAFLLLLGRPADTDWPVITVGFDFEKPRNNSQNGSKTPPHATHLFWQKIHGVPGTLPLLTYPSRHYERPGVLTFTFAVNPEFCELTTNGEAVVRWPEKSSCAFYDLHNLYNEFAQNVRNVQRQNNHFWFSVHVRCWPYLQE